MIQMHALVGILFTTVLLLGRPQQPASIPAEDSTMQRVDKPNPNAPAELSRFGFLIGRWRCDAKLMSANGEWQTFHATWVGHYILDGYAIADEYRMSDSSGKLIVLGMNFRSYDAAKQTWNIKWLNALAGTWVDLGPEELGGVTSRGQSIVYAFKEPVAAHSYTRATYTNVSKTHFTWRGEKSNDGKTWSEFMVVEAYRTEE